MAPSPASWGRKTPSWQCGPISQSSACTPCHPHSHPRPSPSHTQPNLYPSPIHLRPHPHAAPNTPLYPSPSPHHTILTPSPPHPHPIPILILYPSHPCTHLHAIPGSNPPPSPHSSCTHPHPVLILTPSSSASHAHPHPAPTPHPSPSPRRTQHSTPRPHSSAAGLPGGCSPMELLQIHPRRPPRFCRPRSQHRDVRQRLPARSLPRAPDPTGGGRACSGERRSGRVVEQRPFVRGWDPRGGMGGGSDPLIVRRVPSSRLGRGGLGGGPRSDALLQPRHPLRALGNGHRTGAGPLTLSFAARRRGSADAHPPGEGGRGGRLPLGTRRERPARLRRWES